MKAIEELIELARREYDATSDATWSVAAACADADLHKLRDRVLELEQALEMEHRRASGISVRKAYDPELDR